MTDSFNGGDIEGAPAASTSADAAAGRDVDMAEGTSAATGEHPNDHKLPITEGVTEGLIQERVTFAQYLSTPVVTLVVGSGGNETILTAHQGLLVKSPYFSEVCAKSANDGSPCQIELPNEDVDAMGSFLEFLYTGDYFPKKVPGQRTLERHPSIPEIDMTGEQLLRHAKIYTLAEKFGLAHLKSLASSKIHCINSTAKGEIAYARYVYQYSSKEDTTIRAPVANFWATRSHTLRAEAEEEFRSLCLEYPEFGYDVLTRVLDEKLKRERNEKMHPGTPSSARKRPRHSSTGV